MAYTRITHTRFGKEAIDYVLKGRAHNADRYVNKRVLEANGVNCTVKGCEKQMEAVWKRFHVNHPTTSNRRQVQRLIVSFDPGQLNYKRPQDIKTAQSIGTELANKLYPTRQSIIVTQADGQGHKLHDHILTNMIDPITGKSMTSRQTSWRPITKVADSIIKARGLDPTRHKYIENGTPVSPDHETDAEYHLKAQGKYSWVADLRCRLHKISFNSVSWTDFLKNGRENSICIDPYRKRKGKPRLAKNGHPMFKKHITFIFTDRTGKQRKIRDRRLGENFSKLALERVFAHVADEANQVKALKQAKTFEAKQKREAKRKARLLKQAEIRRKKLERQNEILEAKHQRAIKQTKDDQRQRVQAQTKFESRLKRQKTGFLAKCKQFVSRYFGKFLYLCELGKFYWQLIKAGKASAPSDQILTKMKQKAQSRKSKLLNLFYKNQNGPEL